jgi:hypothetical protein
VLPYPGRFRLALMGARIAKPFARLMPGRLKGMVAFAPASLPPRSPMDAPQVFPAEGERRMRVALMTGCAQKVLNTDINAATIRLLTRHGCEVVVAKGAGCCGALTHHMGKTASSHGFAAGTSRPGCGRSGAAGLDAVVINTSGCGTTVKDYGHIFRTEPLAQDAAAVSAMTKDVSEIMVELGLNVPEFAEAAVAEGSGHALVSADAPEDGKAQGYDALRTEADEGREAGVEVLQVPGLEAPRQPRRRGGRRARGGCGSPITRRARCSTASRSRRTPRRS